MQPFELPHQKSTPNCIDTSYKKVLQIILNEFIQLTRYNRSYTASSLCIKILLGYMNIAGKRVKLIRDNRKIKRKKKIYDQEVFTTLEEISS